MKDFLMWLRIKIVKMIAQQSQLICLNVFLLKTYHIESLLVK